MHCFVINSCVDKYVRLLGFDCDVLNPVFVYGSDADADLAGKRI